MNPLMLNEVSALAESLPAFITVVRFLSSMSILMFSQMSAPAKGFVTFIALIGLLSSVNSLMLCQMGALAKGLFTLITMVGFFFCVCFFDVEQEMNNVERLCHTRHTHKALLPCEFSYAV